ncbi:MAG: ParB/RepB/Spo0J family partition protein [bacterium]|nr:MAG: ParB/RepB/Spo0J family partition protein [bacterium]
MTRERKRQALGKGLGALIPGGEEAAEQGEVLLVPIGEVFPNPEQPRRAFDRERLEELAASIREKGVIQPILVHRVPGGYEMVAGERRLRASKLAGLERVPVHVRRIGDDRLELALIENIQRENLNPIEEAQAYRELQGQHGLTQEDIAERVGKDRATVANALRLLSLPEFVKEELIKGTISAGHARALIGLRDEASVRSVLGRILKMGLSVREVERIVGRAKAHRPARRQPAQADPEIRDLERRLERYLGTKARIRDTKKGGRVEITYSSLEELNGIVDKIFKR